MKRETPNQKLRRELADARRQLLCVCVDSNTKEAQRIIMNQKVLLSYSKMPQKIYYESLKSIGFGLNTNNKFEHYEQQKDAVTEK